MSEPLADHLAAFWFQAAAHHGLLAETVATLRAALKERGMDETPFLLTLSAPRLSNDEHVRDQARAELRTLAEEPALRDALAELLRYDPPEEAA